MPRRRAATVNVGDLVRPRRDGNTFITWASEFLAIVTRVEEKSTVQDITIAFPDGEEVLMSRDSMELLFEVVSEAPIDEKSPRTQKK